MNQKLLDHIKDDYDDKEFMELVRYIKDRIERIDKGGYSTTTDQMNQYRFDNPYEHLQPDFNTLDMYDSLVHDRDLWQKGRK